MSNLQTQSIEQFIAVKRTDAKRIKQVDNLSVKQYFTTYKLPAEFAPACIQLHLLYHRGVLQQQNLPKLIKGAKKKKKILMARGKDVSLSEASQLIKMSMNFFTTELRGSGAMSVLRHSQEKQFQF